MIRAFDRIVITVPDVAVAAGDYGCLLGASVEPRDTPGRPRCAWVNVSNTVIELVEGDVADGAISGIVLNSSSGSPVDMPVPNPLQLDIRLCDGTATAQFRQRHPASLPEQPCVDHLVLRSGDADACVELFRDRLDIRLALDQAVPAWGGRMLFFRAAKLTLEVIEEPGSGGDCNAFWGIAYQCPDIEHTVARLQLEGVELSGIRQGRKPGTRVATVKSHALGIPTLLLEPPA